MEIYIVSGFLGSGKTKLINHWLAHPELEGKKALLLQTENGKTKPTAAIAQLEVKTLSKGWLEPETLMTYLKQSQADLTIIELNGFDSATPWVLQLTDPKWLRQLSLKVKLRQVVHCIKAIQYEQMHRLMPEVFDGHQTHADQLYITATGPRTPKQRPALDDLLSAHVNRAKKQGLAVHYDCEENPLVEDFSFMRLGTKLAPEWSKPLVLMLLMLIAIYMLKLMPDDSGRFARMILSFSGMLFQAFPFLMAGVLLAAWINVYISEEAILKWFPKNKFTATLYGLLGGVALPVCDCSIIPVSSQLLRKGVPANAAYSFMLAAPLVNPIAIWATWYAFPENHGIVLYRILAALSVALIGGFIFAWLFPVRTMKPVSEDLMLCDCDGCKVSPEAETLSKPVRLMLHAGDDFLKTAPYLVVGALVASLFQIYGGDAFLSYVAASPALSLLFMMLAAFLLSVCSSSDAFIGRTLVNQFTIQSVMGFLVLGAMMDVKNMALLLRHYSAKQVLAMAAILLTLTYCVISLGNYIAAIYI